jgi:hypothetical protein
MNPLPPSTLHRAKPLAQIAYEAYCKHFGCAVPPFEELPHKIKDSLEVGINAALITYLDDLSITLRHERNKRVKS